MSRRYAILDVFTARPLAGNPLAVVLDPEGLDAAVMQAIAREFGLPETVFVFPPRREGSRAALRIFTPAAELPFAGHPTVGTAVLLGLRDRDAAPDFVLDEEVGPVPCRVDISGERAGRAVFELPRLPYEAGEAAANEAIAAALGLEPEEIGIPGHRSSRFGVGAPFTLVPLRDREALARARPDMGRWQAAFGSGFHNAAYIYARGGAEGGDFRARMFAPEVGIPEDPATGSAAASFAGALMRFERLADGEHAFLIEQGVEMGRPSRIELGLRIAAGSLERATIAGEAVLLAEGRLFA